MFEEFIDAFDLADIVYVTEVYAAGEQSLIDFNQERLVKELQKKKEKVILGIEDQENLLKVLHNNAQPEDIVIFMGAGDITKWAYQIFESYQKST